MPATNTTARDILLARIAKLRSVTESRGGKGFSPDPDALTEGLSP